MFECVLVYLVMACLKQILMAYIYETHLLNRLKGRKFIEDLKYHLILMWKIQQ